MEPVDRNAKKPSPGALAAISVASLLLFTAIGWTLHGLRRQEPRRTGPPIVVSAKDASGADEARGRLVFQVHCARCHGSGGHGDGPEAAALRPPPRDLTGLPWRTAATPDALRRTIREGVPGTMMAGLAAAISPRELDALVDFVRSIAPEAAKNPSAPLLTSAGFTPSPSSRTPPKLEILDDSGKSVTLGDLRGKLVFVVFWGTSCASCVKELAELERFAERFGGERLQILPICADETDTAVIRAVARARAPKLPVYFDPTSAARLAFDVGSLPHTALIAPDGRLLGQAEGALPWTAPTMRTLIEATN